MLILSVETDPSFERLKVLILPAGYIINVCISPGTKESAEQSMEIELQLSNAEEDWHIAYCV